jgi:hypothetical protein
MVLETFYRGGDAIDIGAPARSKSAIGRRMEFKGWVLFIVQSVFTAGSRSEAPALL